MKFLYILFNKTINKNYIGTTNNTRRRLYEHNKITKHYTGKVKGEWKLIYSKEYYSDNTARNEEKRLKRAKNRKYIDWYIINNRVRSSTGRATPS